MTWIISGIIVWLIGLPLVWNKLKSQNCLPCQKIVLTLVWPLSLLSCFTYSIIKTVKSKNTSNNCFDQEA